MTRRSREEILVQILKSCASDSLGITRLMSYQNLSYSLLRAYLVGLLSKDLVKLDRTDERTLVSTTDRGLAVLKCYRNGVALLNGHAAVCPLLQASGKA